MQAHIALIICCIASVELFIRSDFKSSILSIMAFSEKAIKIIKSENISDHWKEKIIPIYAIFMFKYSIKSFFILILILTIFFLPIFLVDNFFYFSLSIFGIIESIVFCLAYFKIRKIIF